MINLHTSPLHRGPRQSIFTIVSMIRLTAYYSALNHKGLALQREH